MAGLDAGNDDWRAQQRYRLKTRPAPVTKEEFEDETYIMKKGMGFSMGRAIIINNKTFDDNLLRNERKGTDKDAENMKKLFNDMGFEVSIFPGASSEDMLHIMDKVSNEDHTKNNCFVCVILSHGEEGVVFGTDGEVSVDKLLEKIKGEGCPSLANKPKMVFIQACKNDVHPEEEDIEGLECATEPEHLTVTRKLPTEADFVIAYSTVPGYYTWQNDSSCGSWFIQAVYDVFSQQWKNMDVMTMMTRVARKVSDELSSSGNDDKIPCITSSLRKELQLQG